MYHPLSIRLASIRKEQGITQKKAAKDLEISQALLSHYEKGIRECGLSFLVKACDYYHVSADFLLGRSMEKVSSPEVPQDVLPETSAKGSLSAALAKRLITNSISLLFDLIEECKNSELSFYANEIFSLEIYKIFYTIYSRGIKPHGLFTLNENEFPYRVNARLLLCDMQVTNIIKGANWAGSPYQPVNSELFPDVSYDALMSQYPALSKSLFNLLNTAEKSILKNT